MILFWWSMSPAFQYKAKNSTLENVDGTVEASSMDEAIKKLQQEGLFILAVEKEKTTRLRHTFMSDMKENITEWCEERNGFFRLPLLIWFAYIFVRHIMDPNYYDLLGSINLGFHEFGHMIFGFGGTFLMTTGGTILQLLVPLLGVLNFLRQSDYFAAVLCFGWLSSNFFGVALYASDAQAMALPLVTPFGMTPAVSHDWNYMLTQMGILSYDAAVALFFRFCAVLSMAFCLVVGGWMVFLMIKNPSKLKRKATR